MNNAIHVCVSKLVTRATISFGLLFKRPIQYFMNCLSPLNEHTALLQQPMCVCVVRSELFISINYTVGSNLFLVDTQTVMMEPILYGKPYESARITFVPKRVRGDDEKKAHILCVTVLLCMCQD